MKPMYALIFLFFIFKVRISVHNFPVTLRRCSSARPVCVLASIVRPRPAELASRQTRQLWFEERTDLSVHVKKTEQLMPKTHPNLGG